MISGGDFFSISPHFPRFWGGWREFGGCWVVEGNARGTTQLHVISHSTSSISEQQVARHSLTRKNRHALIVKTAARQPFGHA